jgi:O-antigen/teichoic acid export membrane protein
VLVSGTAAAQCISLLATPILSRLYTPAAFGQLGVFVSLAGMGAVIANLRYETAIVIADGDGEAANLVAVALSASVGISAVTALALLLSAEWLADLLSMPGLAGWAWWLPPVILASGAYQALSHWSTRQRRFRQVAVTRAAQSGATAITQLGGAMAGAGGAGLIAGYAFGHTIAASGLLWHLRAQASRAAQSVRWVEMCRVAVGFREFPVYSTPQALVNTLSQSMPALVLAPAFGAATAGFYLFAERLLLVPMGLVGQSVRQALLPKAADQARTGRGSEILLGRLTLGLAALAFIPAVLVVTVGPWIFHTVLGPGWREAGEYARWMAVWLYFGFINVPAVVVAQAHRMQRGLFFYDLALLVGRAGALGAGALAGSVLLAVGLFAAVGALFNLGLIVAVGVALRRVTLATPASP